MVHLCVRFPTTYVQLLWGQKGREIRSSGTRVHRQLWAVVEVMEIKSKPSSEAASSLNCWAIYPDSGFLFVFFLSYNSKQWRKGLLNYHEIQFLPKLVPLLFPGTCSQPWDYFSDIWGPFCCRHSQLTFPHLWTKSLWWQSSLSHSSVQCLLPMWDPKGSRTSTYLLNHLMLWRVSVHMSTGYTRPSTLATIWIISFSDRTVAKLMKSP